MCFKVVFIATLVYELLLYRYYHFVFIVLQLVVLKTRYQVLVFQQIQLAFWNLVVTRICLAAYEYCQGGLLLVFCVVFNGVLVL